MARYNASEASLYTLIRVVKLNSSLTLSMGGHKHKQFLVCKQINSNRAIHRSVGGKKKMNKQGYLWYFHVFYITVNAIRCITVNTGDGIWVSVHSCQLPCDYKKLLVCLPWWQTQSNSLRQYFRESAVCSKCNYIPVLHSPLNLFIDYRDESRKDGLLILKGDVMQAL